MLFQGELSKLVKDAVLIMLCNQYVITTSLPIIYQCTRGAGIGLLHSAHLASALYVKTIEEVVLAKPSAQSDSIPLYGRYHDDVFFVASSEPAMKSFWHDLRHANHTTFIHDVRQV